MWQLLRDTFSTLELKAKCRRRLQEQVLSLLEHERFPQSEKGWTPVGLQRADEPERKSQTRTRARQLVASNPHAANIIRLLEMYVVGPGLKLTATSQDNRSTSDEKQVLAQAERAWQTFLTQNQRHFSIRELARRTWRDGEAFLRLYIAADGSPTVRFIDPELIATPNGESGSDGLITAATDEERVLAYQRLDPSTGQLAEVIPADEILHLRVGVDSNEARGVSILAPILDRLVAFDQWLETEVQARKLQASIVLWRKVAGGPQQVRAAVDAAMDQAAAAGGPIPSRERYRPGSIVTTSQGTDLQFLQPSTNFGDAMPLGRLLLLTVAAGAGLPEFMLSSDAANSNFSSTMVAEGPAVKLFESEQHFFAQHIERLWRWVLHCEELRGLLPLGSEADLMARWSFPQLVNRDRSQERLTDVRLVEADILSRAEVARRDNVDPQAMAKELAAERNRDPSIGQTGDEP